MKYIGVMNLEAVVITELSAEKSEFVGELSRSENPLEGSVKKFVSLEENDSFLVRITI